MINHDGIPIVQTDKPADPDGTRYRGPHLLKELKQHPWLIASIRFNR